MKVRNALLLGPRSRDPGSSQVDQIVDVKGEHANGAVVGRERKPATVGTERELPSHTRVGPVIGAEAELALRSHPPRYSLSKGEDLPRAEILGATPQQIAMARWAVGRFEAAGLPPPAVEIEFHPAPSGCGGHLGFARSGQVDVCTTLSNTMARRTLLHEMSHIWIGQHVDDATEARFLVLRDLSSWNAASDPWRLRGCEQAAEIVSWALGERILTPQIPDDDPDRIDEAYRVLTGQPLPPG